MTNSLHPALVRTCLIISFLLLWGPSPGWAQSGVAVTPDGLSHLVNKDLAGERWTISLNLAGQDLSRRLVTNVTGNVFREGQAPAFVVCQVRSESTGNLADPESTFRFSCDGSSACNGTALECSRSNWTLLSREIDLPASFFLPTVEQSTNAVVTASAPTARPLQTPSDRGATLSYDGLSYLVSKDIGNQRWSIVVNLAPTITESGQSRNELVSVTGNVFNRDGSPPQFVYCTARDDSTGDLGERSEHFPASVPRRGRLHPIHRRVCARRVDPDLGLRRAVSLVPPPRCRQRHTAIRSGTDHHRPDVRPSFDRHGRVHGTGELGLARDGPGWIVLGDVSREPDRGVHRGRGHAPPGNGRRMSLSGRRCRRLVHHLRPGADDGRVRPTVLVSGGNQDREGTCLPFDAFSSDCVCGAVGSDGRGAPESCGGALASSCGSAGQCCVDDPRDGCDPGDGDTQCAGSCVGTGGCDPVTESCGFCSNPCGDGIVGGLEECDDDNLNGESCRSRGYTRGRLRCRSDCYFDERDCELCGDGVLQGSEACDGVDLGGENCESLGFAGGTLACGSNCSFATDDCVPGCEVTNTCVGDPTFIQLTAASPPPAEAAEVAGIERELEARILVPVEAALIRGEVPVFGVAAGSGFARYRLEYGSGSEPRDWTLIASGDEPQPHAPNAQEVALSAADTSIRGNLGTWDTGLTSYVYLPTYPPNHPVDLKGTYTLRLVVERSDGRTAEDRVTVRVGDVIPNAWGGKVESDDGMVLLHVPEHALQDSFRVIAIEKTPDLVAGPATGREPVGAAYRVTEAGERFTRNVRLAMRFDPRASAGRPASLGIYGYSESRGWTYLPSRRTTEGYVTTDLRRLHSHYALMASEARDEGSRDPSLPAPAEQELVAFAEDRHFLVRDDFEAGLGEWAGRDGTVGADARVEAGAGPDGSAALRVVNRRAGGNFAVTARATPFDARRHSIVRFRYRVPSGVKADFLVKVAGRWYQIGFTDDANVFDGQRVNIAHIGDIDGIVADGEWHSAQFDLYEMLRTKTAHTHVETIVLADWDVTGYMKLRFGTNRADATYWIDDFSIGASEDSMPPSLGDLRVALAVDASESGGRARGRSEIFVDPQGNGKLIARAEASRNEGALALAYDVQAPGSFAVYRAAVPSADLRGFGALSLRVGPSGVRQLPLVGLIDDQGRERKVRLSNAWLEPADEGGQRASVPISVFADTVALGKVTGLTFSFENGAHTAGEASISDVRFERILRGTAVETFDQDQDRNVLGRPRGAYVSGDAALTATVLRNEGNGIYRLNYGGRIGEASSFEPGLSFGGWMTELGGVDCSSCGVLRLRARGSEGGERPNVYLDDGSHRWMVDLEDYGPISTAWRDYEIPLEEFARNGVDLTHLARLDVVFEWERANGSLYLDEIHLGYGRTIARGPVGGEQVASGPIPDEAKAEAPAH